MARLLTSFTFFLFATALANGTGFCSDHKTVVEGGAQVSSFDYQFNSSNQLTNWTEKDGFGAVVKTVANTFDHKGNRASQAIDFADTATPDEVTTYQWTSENRLAGVTTPDGLQHSYEYDFRARRIGRTEPINGTTAVTYTGGLNAGEYNLANAADAITGPADPAVAYVRGPDMGGGIGGLLYSLRGGTAKFNLSNGRGDIVAQSDSTAALTWTASYEAFGKRPLETGVNQDRQRANTKEEDPTGLLHEHFRYRDLETGVWLSRDPAGFVDGPNLYAYVRQNPWSFFDPLGLAGDEIPAQSLKEIGSNIWSDIKNLPADATSISPHLN